jgi:DNA-binding transcriptional MocR family regulator
MSPINHSRKVPGIPALDAPFYRRVSDEIAAMIAGGSYRPGERIPSVRRLMEQKHASAPTIIEALRVLEDRGLIEARPRSGHFVRPQPLASDPPSPGRLSSPTAVRVLEAVNPIMNAAYYPGGLPFSAAVPSPELFPLPQLRRIMASLVRQHTTMLGNYAFAPGLIELRREIARRTIDWGCVLDAGDITITNGCVEAVGLALRAVTAPGDIVAVESPGYYGFFHMLEMLHLRAVEIPSDARDGLSIADLRQAIACHPIKACLASTTVTNPSGASMPLVAKKALVKLLGDAGIPLIEDATFADLHFGGETTAAKAFDPAGDVLLCASLTKTIAPGLRVGWIDGGKHAERIGFLKRITSIGQPELAQRTLAEYLATGGVDRHLRRLRRGLGDRVERHLAAAQQHLPVSTRVIRPTGGFLLWLELDPSIDGVKLHRDAIDSGIGIAPGSMFGAVGSFSNYIRINCGHVWRPDTDDAYRALGTFAERQLAV